MAGSGYRRFARSRLYEYILVVMLYEPGYSTDDGNQYLALDRKNDSP